MNDGDGAEFTYTGTLTRWEAVCSNLMLYWRHFRFTTWRTPLDLLVVGTAGSLLIGAHLHAVVLCLVPLMVVLVIIVHCHLMIIAFSYAMILIRRWVAHPATVSFGVSLHVDVAHSRRELQWSLVKEVLVTRRFLMIVLTNGHPLCLLPSRTFAHPDERPRLLAFLGSVGVPCRRILGPGL